MTFVTIRVLICTNGKPSTPFDYNMARISVTDLFEVPDPFLIHLMQVTVLMYSLHTCPDIMHAVHQLSRIVHNPGQEHIKALNHSLWYLAGTTDLVFVVRNWTEVYRIFPSGFHGSADATHKNSEQNHRGITGIAIFFLETLLLSQSFVQDQGADSSCECEYYAYSTVWNTWRLFDYWSVICFKRGLRFQIFHFFMWTVSLPLQLPMVVLQGQRLNRLTSRSGCVGIMSLENWCSSHCSSFTCALISRLLISHQAARAWTICAVYWPLQVFSFPSAGMIGFVSRYVWY